MPPGDYLSVSRDRTQGAIQRDDGDVRRSIRRLCAAYAFSAADREDLFQDIFLAVWRALPGFRGDSSVRTWLYRIAHNVA